MDQRSKVFADLKKESSELKFEVSGEETDSGKLIRLRDAVLYFASTVKSCNCGSVEYDDDAMNDMITMAGIFK